MQTGGTRSQHEAGKYEPRGTPQEKNADRQHGQAAREHQHGDARSRTRRHAARQSGTAPRRADAALHQTDEGDRERARQAHSSQMTRPGARQSKIKISTTERGQSFSPPGVFTKTPSQTARFPLENRREPAAPGGAEATRKKTTAAGAPAQSEKRTKAAGPGQRRIIFLEKHENTQQARAGRAGRAANQCRADASRSGQT